MYQEQFPTSTGKQYLNRDLAHMLFGYPCCGHVYAARLPVYFRQWLPASLGAAPEHFSAPEAQGADYTLFALGVALDQVRQKCRYLPSQWQDSW